MKMLKEIVTVKANWIEWAWYALFLGTLGFLVGQIVLIWIALRQGQPPYVASQFAQQRTERAFDSPWVTALYSVIIPPLLWQAIRVVWKEGLNRVNVPVLATLLAAAVVLVSRIVHLVGQ